MGADRRFTRVGMSPFLSELSPGSYERLEPRPVDSNAFSFRSQASEPLPSPTKKKKLALKDFAVGRRVNHPFFGAGTVRKLSAPRSLDVAFDRHGLKTLHLDYATLNIVDG
jgi:DNA helicase-2/ATP-dependent DNA helicase PcrA